MNDEPRGKDVIRSIPAVDRLLGEPRARELEARWGRNRLLGAIRAHLDELRRSILGGDGPPPETLTGEGILEAVARLVDVEDRPGLCRAVNATGVVLHTGLGRAPLPEEAVRAVAEEASGYCVLEVDAVTGERGRREEHVARLLTRLTGAEAATAVNNNAGATLIALAALARGREVVVSRGQLVEIGGSFRIPEIMAESGARMVEIGTTNKTRLGDYERALTGDTAAFLLVHTSNFKVVGFHESVAAADLVALGRRKGILVLEDLGSGALVDFSRFGFEPEPTVAEAVAAGVDVATFSGDKLLGGPQAGLIVGTAAALAKIRAHPLFRALRPDKLTLAALEATLRGYLEPDRVGQRNRTLALLSRPLADLEGQARALAADLGAIAGVKAGPLEESSQPGSGSLPAQTMRTWAVAVEVEGMDAGELARALRLGVPPVFARVHRETLLVDVRTLSESETREVVAALGRIAGS